MSLIKKISVDWDRFCLIDAGQCNAQVIETRNWKSAVVRYLSFRMDVLLWASVGQYNNR